MIQSLIRSSSVFLILRLYLSLTVLPTCQLIAEGLNRRFYPHGRPALSGFNTSKKKRCMMLCIVLNRQLWGPILGTSQSQSHYQAVLNWIFNLMICRLNLRIGIIHLFSKPLDTWVFKSYHVTITQIKYRYQSLWIVRFLLPPFLPRWLLTRGI